MKNKLLMGLIGIGLLLPLGVKAETLDSVAEGSNSSSATVTVGEVETPVYDVEISWDSLQFNWVYYASTNEYGWEIGYKYEGCQKLSEYPDFNEEAFNAEKATMYTDLRCKTKVTDDLTYEMVSGNLENYYVSTGSVSNTSTQLNEIWIKDYSTGGEVVPSVKWTSSTNYSYFYVDFNYYADMGKKCYKVANEETFLGLLGQGEQMYSDSTCDTKLDESVTVFNDSIYKATQYAFADLTTESIPENGRHNLVTDDSTIVGSYYQLHLYPHNSTEPTTTPKAGDILGTVTITISAAE